MLNILKTRTMIWILVLLAVTAATAVVVAVAQDAYAYNLLGSGCRYDPDNDDDGLGIGFDDSRRIRFLRDAAEELSTEHAASAWNNVMTPQFTIVDYGSSQRDLGVTWRNLGNHVGAELVYYCSSWLGHYWRDPSFRWGADANYYDSTSGRRIAIAIHEIGHSYGLAHSDTSGCGSSASLLHSNAVEKHDLCGWTDPRSDSIAGATDAHNG